MKRQKKMRNDLLDLRSRFRRRSTIAYGILVLIVAFSLNIIFLNPVDLGDYSSVDTSAAYAEVSASLDAEVNTSAIRAREIWDSDSFNISWGTLENYQMLDKLGMGWL